MKKYRSFLSENFQFLEVKFSIYLNRCVFVMCVFVMWRLCCPYLFLISPSCDTSGRLCLLNVAFPGHLQFYFSVPIPDCLARPHVLFFGWLFSFGLPQLSEQPRSCETLWIRRLAWIFPVRICFNGSFLMTWLHYRRNIEEEMFLSRTSIVRTLMAHSNSFSSPYEIHPITQENKYSIWSSHCMLCVLIWIASSSTLKMPLLSRKLKKKISPYAYWHGAMINHQWLELPLPRTSFHGPKGVRVIEVWLFFHFNGSMLPANGLWNSCLLYNFVVVKNSSLKPGNI